MLPKSIVKRYQTGGFERHTQEGWIPFPAAASIGPVFNNVLHTMTPTAHPTRADVRTDLRSDLHGDTRAWKAQVWISFGAAVTLCASGLAWLPGADLDRAFMVMGYLFTMSSAFVLAKHVRDNQTRRVDTPLWGAVVWLGFGLAMALTAWGLLRMEINPTYKAYLGVSWLFLVSSVFTLAKTLRDAHEAALARARGEGRQAAWAAGATTAPAVDNSAPVAR